MHHSGIHFKLCLVPSREHFVNPFGQVASRHRLIQPCRSRFLERSKRGAEVGVIKESAYAARGINSSEHTREFVKDWLRKQCGVVPLHNAGAYLGPEIENPLIDYHYAYVVFLEFCGYGALSTFTVRPFAAVQILRRL